MVKRVEKTEAEWREQMTDLEYEVRRRKGTERALRCEYEGRKDRGLQLPGLR